MIKGNENLGQVVEVFPEAKEFFTTYGLGLYFEEENLKKIGDFTRLDTLLKSKGIEIDSFLKVLNASIKSEEGEHDPNKSLEGIHFSAMLPCGLRNPFKEITEQYFLDHTEEFSTLNYLLEGNVNHELSYYPMLDHITDSKELPDVIMASDVNNFFHKPFMTRFVETGLFETYQPYEWNSYLENVGFADPDKNFTMFTANFLVLVVDKTKLNGREVPQKWSDILKPEWEQSIIMRGEDNFFCNAVMLPFYKDHGMDAIKKLAKNIKSGLHPAQMVKLAGTDKPEGTPLYIMPYFFSKRIKDKNVEVVSPVDGPIVSPVFFLVKKEKIEQHKQLLDFLFSKEISGMLFDREFPVVHPDADHTKFPQTIKWLGWDFINKHDIGQLKEDIREQFLAHRQCELKSDS